MADNLRLLKILINIYPYHQTTKSITKRNPDVAIPVECKKNATHRAMRCNNNKKELNTFVNFLYGPIPPSC